MDKCEEHTGCMETIKRNAKDIGTIFELIEKIRNRLPNWAVALISILMGIIGWLAKGS